MSNRPMHVPSGTAPSYAFGEHVFRFLATGQDTGGGYSVMEMVSPKDPACSSETLPADAPRTGIWIGRCSSCSPV
jgi:hypothetical protein